jgi:hypothetical protein
MTTGDNILSSVQASLYCAQTAIDVEIRKRDQRIAELETLLGIARGNVEPPSPDAYLLSFARLGEILGMRGRFLVDYGFEQIEKAADKAANWEKP